MDLARLGRDEMGIGVRLMFALFLRRDHVCSQPALRIESRLDDLPNHDTSS